MKSPGSDYSPPAENPAPSGQLNPTPGGGAPNWNSILPQGGGPAQLSDPFRSEANGPPVVQSAPISTPPAGAATSAASPAMSAAAANLPPDVKQQYMAAKAEGNDDLAARILLAATMQGMSPVARNTDRSGMGAPSGGGPGPGWGGGIAGGVGGRSSGGLY